ncbi:MAG: amidohydrolase [Crocinitomicaceae bacterium]
MTIDALIELRKTLHAHPELSGEEEKTSHFIEQEIHKFGNFTIFKVGKTSLLARRVFDEDGPHLMFRCELDALPIKEINDFHYRSKIDGVSHKCGHDGHMAIMMSLANKLTEKDYANGTVSLLFQSAEENGKGAEEILANENFQSINPPDFIFALHNVPGYPLHQIILKKGVLTPSVISVEITFKGKTSHAAEPEKGINPALPITVIIRASQEKQNPDQDSENFCVFAPVYLEMGEKSYGVSAGEGMVGLTIRCWTADYMDELIQWVTAKVNEIGATYGIETEMRWFESFSSVENNEKSVDMIREAAESLGMSIHDKEKPFRWGEDFGLYTQKMKGAMFALGAGENVPALHNPDYDFPDEIITSGSEIFMQIIERKLNE